MATYSGDRKIQFLAVYKTLLDATPESPATVSKVIQNVKKNFNISVSRATVGADIILHRNCRQQAQSETERQERLWISVLD